MMPLHIKKFNDKVRAMNDGRGKTLTMEANEARALHCALFAVLEELNRLRTAPPLEEEVLEVSMDPGDESLPWADTKGYRGKK